MCLIASAGFFVLRDELRWERDVLDRSYTMMLDHEVAAADAQLTLLDTLILGQLRIWRNWRNPFERMLRGTIKIEQGEYGVAVRYLDEARSTCDREAFDHVLCTMLSGELFFREANAMMSSRQKRAWNVAITYYESGLLIDPDDVLAKKSLDWLKVHEENTEDGQDSNKDKQGPDRSGDELQKNAKPGNSGGGMRKGY